MSDMLTPPPGSKVPEGLAQSLWNQRVQRAARELRTVLEEMESAKEKRQDQGEAFAVRFGLLAEGLRAVDDYHMADDWIEGHYRPGYSPRRGKEPFWIELAADAEDEQERRRYLMLSTLYDRASDCADAGRINAAADKLKQWDQEGQKL